MDLIHLLLVSEYSTNLRRGVEAVKCHKVDAVWLGNSLKDHTWLLLCLISNLRAQSHLCRSAELYCLQSIGELCSDYF